MNFVKIFLFAVIFFTIGTHAYADKVYKCNRVVIYKDGKPLYVTPYYSDDIIKMPRPAAKEEPQVVPPAKTVKEVEPKGNIDILLINNNNIRPFPQNTGSFPDKPHKEQIVPKDKNK